MALPVENAAAGAPSHSVAPARRPGPRPGGFWIDFAFRSACRSAAICVIVLAVLLVAVLVWRAWESLQVNGLAFFTTATWDPVPTHRVFGALAFVYGTVVTSAIAMLIAIPLGVGTAAYLAEIAPHRLRRTGAFLVEMLAAIPSVVYGFWGLYVFAPWLQRVVVALGGPRQSGIGLLSAGIVLGIMIVPYASAVSFDVIRAVPRSQREVAVNLGATRWQTIWSVVLVYARPGIVGGCFLALGRALGETMAVTMLIGNRPDLPNLSLEAILNGQLPEALRSLVFAKGNSIPSVIANEFTEATYDLYLSALVELGLILLCVSVGFSALGRLLIWRMNRPSRGRGLRSFFSRRSSGERPTENITAATPERKPGARAAVLPRGVPRRSAAAQAWDRVMTGGRSAQIALGLGLLALLAGCAVWISFTVPDPDTQLALSSVLAILGCLVAIGMLGVLGLCLVATVVPLFLILGYLLYRGGTSLNWDFFTKLPAPVGQTGGGMVNAIYGSALMVGLATALSVPIGVFAAIYLAEFRRSRLAPVVRFVGEMLGSVPSIVIGIFGYYAIVRTITGSFSGLAGGFSLAIMMLPIVMRASEEALKLVPRSIRDASYALGAGQAQTTLRVLVPAALPAIITAVFLGIARVAGETAPLLLTASSNTYWPRSLNDYTPSLPVYIFNYAISPYDDWHRQAWAAAFVLVSAIMVLNVSVRLIAGKRVLVASQAD